jgi:cell shape-determining protein MreC
MRAQSGRNSSRKRLPRVVVFSLLFILVGFLIPKVISTIASTVMYPVHMTKSWLANSSSLIPTLIRDRESFKQEIQKLENDLVVAGYTDVSRSRLVEENNRLRELLGIDGESRTAAAIIARPDELPYDLLQIDRGSNHGIEIGAPVFIGSDIVVGLIVHTAPEYSFVQLVTTHGSEATAFISGPNVVVTMEGMGGGVARVRVPQGIPLTVGDLVYLPSVEPGVFGRVSFVENRPTQPEQYGYISPDIALSSLYYVSVGKLSQLSRSAEEIDKSVLELMQKELLNQAVTVGIINASTTVATTSSSTPPE